MDGAIGMRLSGPYLPGTKLGRASLTLPPSAGAVSLRNAVLSGHPLRDVLVGDAAAISEFEKGGVHADQARPLAIPSDPAARLRFVQAFLAEQAARRSRGLNPQLLVLP